MGVIVGMRGVLVVVMVGLAVGGCQMAKEEGPRAIGALEDPQTPGMRAVRAKLDKNVREVQAHNQGIERVLTFLSDTAEVQFIVNWTALQAAGVDRTTPVSVSLKDVSLGKALKCVLLEVAGGGANLDYTIDDDAVAISTRDDLDSPRHRHVRVFDVSSVLRSPTAEGRQEEMNQIVEAIKTTVAPGSWRGKADGSVGTIGQVDERLVVNHTMEGQLAVYDLLRRLGGKGEQAPMVAAATSPAAVEDAMTAEVKGGDVLRVTIGDLQGPGQSYSGELLVDGNGNISVPDLGDVRVVGMTVRGIEETLAKAAVSKEVLLPKGDGNPGPQIKVQRVQWRSRPFLKGAETVPATAPATKPAA